MVIMVRLCHHVFHVFLNHGKHYIEAVNFASMLLPRNLTIGGTLREI